MLYLRDRSSPKTGPYFTLSHCWGVLKPISLTTKSEASLRAGVAVASLPKTFRDAVFVCDAFNVSYLWIDSMCIFQDNINDWHKEATLMRNVYSHAICNIAATAAWDGSVGLFFDRDQMGQCPFWVQSDHHSNFFRDKTVVYPAGGFLVCPKDQWMNELEMSPLNRRAWVLQERFLSVRVMHFARSQVFWECYENSSSEIFPNATPEWAGPSEQYESQKLKLLLSRTDRDQYWREEVHQAWQSLLMVYSGCGLSKESDKLVAINGIVQHVSTATGDKFIGGLWESRFLQDLCWMAGEVVETRRSPGSCSPRKWRAPTWSWAAQDVQACPSDVVRYDSNSPNLQSRVTIQNVNIDTMSSGQLKHASLILQGRIVYATFSCEEDPLCCQVSCRCSSTVVSAHMVQHEVLFRRDDAKLHFQEDLVCLAIWAYDSKNPIPDPSDRQLSYLSRYFETLVLRPRESGVDHYERVGTAMFFTEDHMKEGDGSYEFYAEHETEEMQNVVIF